MATYVNNLRLKEIATGDESGTWGTSTNTNLELITDGFSYGTKQLAADANETFTMSDGSADDTRSFYLKITSAVSLTATREVTLGPNTVSKVWMIENATTGSQIITIKQGSGATVNVPNGSKVMVVTDGAGAGAAVLNANPTELDSIGLSSVLATGNTSGGTGLTMSSGDDLTLTGASYNATWDSSANALVFGDNAKALFGAGNDLEIYHDGSNSRIDDTGTGNLIIRGSSAVSIQKYTGEVIGQFTADGAVDLYYDNVVKLSTISTGVDVTGTVQSDSLTDGSGTAKINYDSSVYFNGLFSDTVNALGNTGTAVTINANSGQVFTATLTGNCTFTLASANSTSNRATSFTLILTNDATPSRTVAFSGGTVEFPGGSVSRTTDANATDIWFFFSPDGGTTWYGSIPMKNLS